MFVFLKRGRSPYQKFNWKWRGGINYFPDAFRIGTMLPFLKWRLPVETARGGFCVATCWKLHWNSLETKGEALDRALEHYTPPSPIDNARNTSPARMQLLLLRAILSAGASVRNFVRGRPLFFLSFLSFFPFLRQETQLLRTFFCCSSPLMGKVNYLEPRRTLECCIFLDHRFNWIFSNFFFFFLLQRRAFLYAALYFLFSFECEVLFCRRSFQK